MPGVQPSGATWRRWFGLLFLTLAGVLLLWGLTWLQPHLRGRTFVGYWLTCFIFAALALFVAVVDFFATWRAGRLARRALRREALGAVHPPATAIPERSEHGPRTVSASKPGDR